MIWRDMNSPVGYFAQIALTMRVSDFRRILIDAADGQFMRRSRQASITSSSSRQRGIVVAASLLVEHEWEMR